MNGSSQLTEIIFFACVAVFLGLRLRSLLGRRDDEDQSAPPPSIENNVHPFPVPPHAAAPYARPAAMSPGDPLSIGLAQIRSVDPSFDPAVFLDGAKMAFRMIVEAFARGDEAVLRPLLDDTVFGQFSEAIAARRQAGETNLSELLEVVSVNMMEAGLQGSMAHVTVRFVSRQNILVKNSTDVVIEGGPDHPVQLTDHWSFARDLRSPSPNWLLVATHSSEE